MRTFFRILGYARPAGLYVPQYLLLILLATVFSVINITVLIPLLEVLFDQVDLNSARNTLPDFQVSVRYFKQLFYYYLHQIISGTGKLAALYYICGIVICSVLLANLFRYLSQLILARVRVRVIRNLRNDAFQKISGFDLSFFTARRKGDIVSRVTTDVLEVEQSVVSALKVLVKEPILIMGYFLVLFSMSVELTLYTLLMVPLAGIAIAVIGKRLKQRAAKSQESMGRMNSILDEVLSGMRIVKAFSAMGYLIKKFSGEVDRYARSTFRLAAKSNLVSPLSEVIAVFVIALILLVGGSMVLDQPATLEASEFIGFLLIYSQILAPAKSLSTAFGNIHRGIASGDRIFDLMDTRPKIVEKPHAISLVDFQRDIVFEDVTFSYEQQVVIRNLNLRIKKGEVVALVGPSGAGKSTIADLIPRFYDPTAGRVLIDGVDLKDYRLESLRSVMGIVTQESILFNDTVAGNIAFGRPDVSPEEIKKAAIIANADDFIKQLSGGYDFEIGDHGMKLSGGERQRLAIARAVLRDPQILVLDEATSALDVHSEKLVQEALYKLMKDRTTLIIAHRLSTVQYADKIVVLEHGQLCDQGTHSQLLDRQGLYRQYTEMQSF